MNTICGRAICAVRNCPGSISEACSRPSVSGTILSRDRRTPASWFPRYKLVDSTRLNVIQITAPNLGILVVYSGSPGRIIIHAASSYATEATKAKTGKNKKRIVIPSMFVAFVWNPRVSHAILPEIKRSSHLKIEMRSRNCSTSY